MVLNTGYCPNSSLLSFDFCNLSLLLQQGHTSRAFTVVVLPLERETQGPVNGWRVGSRLMLLYSLKSAEPMSYSVFICLLKSMV